MALIQSVYIDGTDRSGFTFGVDQVTPVTWKFSNRIPKSAYCSYSLGDIASSPSVQEWINRNRQVIMSHVELRSKLREVSTVH